MATPSKLMKVISAPSSDEGSLPFDLEHFPFDVPEYTVWYKHSGQPEVDDWSSDFVIHLLKKVNVGEITADVGHNHITHMWCDRHIPPLDVVAPKSAHLRLSRLVDHSGLQSLTSLSQLTHLDLSGNDFTNGLPNAITGLTTLTKLNLEYCDLTDLPDKLSQLSQLTYLNLHFNHLVEIPCVFHLRALKTLNVSYNRDLSTLDGIQQLRELVEFDCDECSSLVYPPYAVCQQGLDAIKQYFTDLSSTQGVELSVVPVSIVGEKLAGKTSIVQSLQNGCRSLTYRSEFSPLDETTKVFQVKDLPLKNSFAKLIDHGGHEVYHLTYRYILKERNIPLVVVSLEQFSKLSSKYGAKEAVKMVCLDWLSHLYLPSPLLGAPLLVFTHADKLSTSVSQCLQEFLQLTEAIRGEMLAEEDEQWGQDGRLNKIVHWTNREVPLFSREDVFVFSNDKSETANIDALKARLDERCVKFKTVIPQLWEDVRKFVEAEKEKPYIAVSDILSEYPGDDCKVILRYMHNTGSILWFEHAEGLNQYIFHRIPEMTEMITVLFHHRSEEEWKKRLATFTSFRHGKHMINRDEFEKLSRKFTTTGLLDEAILKHLLEKESKFSLTIALQLLERFCIVHGPIKQRPREAYVIPYFATSCMGDSWQTEGKLQLRLDIRLHGLSLPMYGYQLTTVAVLNKTMNPFNTTTVARDGVTVHHGKTSTHLIHRCGEKRMTLQVSTPPQQLGQSWKHFLDTTEDILELLSDVWIACRPSIMFYCSHCLFQRDALPSNVINPEWFYPLCERSSTDKTSPVVSMCHYTGVDPVTCERHADINNDLTPTVPKPLMFPCYQLTDAEIDEVEDYLSELEYNMHANAAVQQSSTGPQPSEVHLPTVQPPSAVHLPTVQPPSAVHPPTVQPPSAVQQVSKVQHLTFKPRPRATDEELSDLSDVEDAGYCGKSAELRITARLRNVKGRKLKDRYNKDDGIYWMSDRVRGRAMIINISRIVRNGEVCEREGSDVDYDNISRLLRELRFDIVKSKQELTDLTAQAIYSEVEQETRNDIHNKLGMFVFVIMSTGQRGDILDDCNAQPIDLMTVKDLLSPVKFPAMKHKPKWLIVQACSGDRYDHGDLAGLGKLPQLPSSVPSTFTADSSVPSTSTADSSVPPTSTADSSVPPTSTVDSSVPSISIADRTNSYPKHPKVSNVDDFMIMKASSESYIATRHKVHGSWFIRVLVMTLYKHAHSRDLRSLFDIIQERVRKVSQSSGKSTNVPISTHILRKKLYLFPGYPVLR